MRFFEWIHREDEVRRAVDRFVRAERLGAAFCGFGVAQAFAGHWAYMVGNFVVAALTVPWAIYEETRLYDRIDDLRKLSDPPSTVNPSTDTHRY